MEDQGKVPCIESVKAKIAEVVEMLNLKGIDFQQTLIQEKVMDYDFLLPKSKYYKYYTHYLFEHGPTSRERLKELEKHERTLQGTIETIPVGAMSQILRQEMRQGHQPYTPLGNQTYEHHFTYNLGDRETLEKIKAIETKHKYLISKKKATKTGKPALDNKNPTKYDEVRKELGANADGSMGVYGGKKYEGLGSRDQFSTFRREQSQSYYSNLQQKLRQG